VGNSGCGGGGNGILGVETMVYSRGRNGGIIPWLECVLAL
jgi:hypothetical protein